MCNNIQLDHAKDLMREKINNHDQKHNHKFNTEEIKGKNAGMQTKAKGGKDLPGKIMQEDSIIRTHEQKTKENISRKSLMVAKNGIRGDKKELKQTRKQGTKNYAVQANLSATTIFRENYHM